MTKPRDFYAITTYFNRFHTYERLRNYHIFFNNLTLPLITVEWAPDGKFELEKKDADLLIQIKEGDLMWQKERLLNIALRSLPGSCKYIAWLDCDIIFNDVNWHERARSLLKNFDFIQLFEKVAYLSKSSSESSSLKEIKFNEDHFEVNSISKTIQSGSTFFNNEKNIWGDLKLNLNGNPGMAYAAKVDLMKKHLFYDKNIVGAGDMILSASLYDKLDEVFLSRSLSSMHKLDIKKWAETIIKAKYKTTFLSERIYHLWHGDLQNRGYSTRWQILTDHNYHPEKNISINSSNTWSWRDASEQLKESIYRYMQNKEGL